MHRYYCVAKRLLSRRFLFWEKVLNPFAVSRSKCRSWFDIELELTNGI